ncbi:hypothetical protein KXD93_15145 [Mucilaginibacter sp. BJC16-A38]|uniref:hypothetical protein n=1 Tax=Mucilaginibacter phenanthrenivorans TaxID=1234842 RepID=UPI002157F9EC|nr:hypothetical protein [Mucilaginibacter phenanthrenivorans]MCR8558992.1 hypothetical protein [Mucilaginibacter phenanthrenivorans]
MKRCLIVLIFFFGLLNMVCGQSRNATVDSLVKYGVITAKQRPTLLKEFKYGGHSSDRVAILAGMESIMMQKTFHINPHKTGIMLSYGESHLNKKSQDSINTTLRNLLEKIKKAGLLTDRVYTYTQKAIDSGHYVAELQMIGTLTEMSSRLEQLAPNKLLPVVQDLHTSGVIGDSSFVRLGNDIRDGKIESSFQLNDYCKLDRVFDLAKYPDDPDVWLEQIHRDMASMVPSLNFTNFSYTTIPDTSFSIPGVRFKVSLVCKGQIYKHTSLAFNNYKNKQGKISPKDIFIEDFDRIFNKVLTDQHSPLRLHSVMFGPGTTTDDHFRHFALIALTAEQTEVFMKEPNFFYMSVSMDGYDSTLTSAKVDSTIVEWRKIGLFAHLSNAEISTAIDNAEADNLFSINKLLVNFPGVIYPLDSSLISPHYPYVNLLSHLARITHGAFAPTKINQRKINHSIKLQYLSKGKIHSHLFHTAYGWLDAGFPAFMKGLAKENGLPGKFYQIKDSNDVIYLTTQQYDYAVTHNLLDLGRQ